MIPSETKHSNTILWEQLWFPRKHSTALQYYENSYDTLGNSTAIPYYENSYDSLGNKAQQYNTMRTVMIPSETQHSNTILWAVLCFRGNHNCSHSMVLLCCVSEGIITVLIVLYSLSFVSEGIITVLIVWYWTAMIPSEAKHSNTMLWEQLWYPRKQSTAISHYENSYDTLGNKEQQYHTMRTVMIPSETKHSNIILWEQLWYPRKQSSAIPYYENSYDTLGNSTAIPYYELSFVSEGIITVLIVWYCCALFPRVS